MIPGEPVSGPETSVPTGTQSLALLAKRRVAFFALVVAIVTVLVGWLAAILEANGFGILDALLVAAFLIQVPTIAIAFANALIGFILVRWTPTPLALVSPPMARAGDSGRIILRTAIAMTMRNEDPARSLKHLETVMASLERTGFGECFDCHVLSDSDEAAAIAAEETFIDAWRTRAPYGNRLFYRRRDRNIGFKGGNVHDFCEHHSRDYDLAVMLDTDSLMAGTTILRMVRIMQANPWLGILQTFAVGLPSGSLFTRIFQFGHRHGMRCFVFGAAWWQGECCQFWGHNCAIRVAPFAESCKLPILSGGPPLGGHIICHDQIEAALMRRAGYEVRFLPEETGSWEGNPPTLPDFIKRNGRWCLGNLQNLRLLFLPGLRLVSRFHLAYMAQKFFGGAMVPIFATLAAVAAATWPDGRVFPAHAALALYLTWLVVYFSPRIFGVLDALLRARSHYGGTAQLVTGGIVEILFNFLLLPVAMFAAAHCMIALIFARTVTWEGQRRDGYRLSWTSAGKAFWQPTVFGAALLGILYVAVPGAIPWFVPFLMGLILAIPFAVFSSMPAIGAVAARWKLCGIPEEITGAPEINAVMPLLSPR